MFDFDNKTFLLIGILIPSVSIWNNVKRQVPDGGLEVIVTAKQYEWNVTYAGPDEVLGTADDFETLNTLHVPMGRPTVVRLRADDVLHSFFIPAMRVKQDAIPGTELPVWFEPTAPGEYVIAAWHEKYGEVLTQKVTVSTGAPTEADLTIVGEEDKK